jgi:signal transduction histidine kinase
MLVLVAIGIAWFVVRQLDRASRQEQDALESARRAVAARDELLGVVAHDLRNPLGAILMRADLLASADEFEQVRRHAGSIQKVARRMEHLIATTLDVTTVEAGRLSVTPVPCGVDELMEAVFEVFAGLASAQHIQLERRGGRALPAISADRDRILQVFSNLIGNALKFTPREGRITISSESQEGAVVFAIADGGPGIAAEDLPHIFDRYWKAKDNAKRGTGLGLFIAKGIVEAHGGRIWALSQPGAGATFHFTIPVAVPSLQ